MSISKFPIISAIDLSKAHHIEPSGAPLRLGLLLEDYMQPQWVSAALAEVVAAGVGKPEAIILNAETNGKSLGAGAGSDAGCARRTPWYKETRNLPYVVYDKLDALRYLKDANPFSLIDTAPTFAGIPVMRVKPRRTKFCDYFEEETVEKILALNLDVVLRFGFRILKGRALEIAKHGVWSFSHGDHLTKRGGPDGLWEVLEGRAVTGTTLQRLTDELDGGLVLARSTASTNPISVNANRANNCWQAAALLARELRRLQDEENGLNYRPDSSADWSCYPAPLYKQPGPTAVARLSVKIASRLIGRKLHHAIKRPQWFLAYGHRKSEVGREDVPSGVPYHFKHLYPPLDRSWADPFPVRCGESHYIFFEEHLFDSPHAHISVVEVKSDGSVGKPRPVLQRDFHLSYPFVLNWQNEWLMIPESGSRRTVEMFRATSFPYEWESLGPILVDLNAVDVTLAQIDQVWWLFAGVMLPGAFEATALNIYHGPSPFGPWTPHRRNPVKIDVRGARPAGRIFRSGENWYRPGQDGAPSYGAATIIHRIDELSPTHFSETVVSRLTPSWQKRLIGTHTLNAADGLTVVDALRMVRRW